MTAPQTPLSDAPDPKLVRYVEMLRHACAYKGPCADNGDGCTCSYEELDARHMRERREALAARSVPDGWRDVGYLMSIIDAAIEDGFDPDEDGPILDEIRAELKASSALAAAPSIASTDHAEWQRAALHEQWVAVNSKTIINDLIAAIGNHGKVSSLHDWHLLQKKAVTDAREWLATADAKAATYAEENLWRTKP